MDAAVIFFEGLLEKRTKSYWAIDRCIPTGWIACPTCGNERCWTNDPSWYIHMTLFCDKCDTLHDYYGTTKEFSWHLPVCKMSDKARTLLATLKQLGIRDPPPSTPGPGPTPTVNLSIHGVTIGLAVHFGEEDTDSDDSDDSGNDND